MSTPFKQVRHVWTWEDQGSTNLELVTPYKIARAEVTVRKIQPGTEIVVTTADQGGALPQSPTFVSQLPYSVLRYFRGNHFAHTLGYLPRPQRGQPAHRAADWRELDQSMLGKLAPNATLKELFSLLRTDVRYQYFFDCKEEHELREKCRLLFDHPEHRHYRHALIAADQASVIEHIKTYSRTPELLPVAAKGHRIQWGILSPARSRTVSAAPGVATVEFSSARVTVDIEVEQLNHALEQLVEARNVIAAANARREALVMQARALKGIAQNIPIWEPSEEKENKRFVAAADELETALREMGNKDFTVPVAPDYERSVRAALGFAAMPHKPLKLSEARKQFALAVRFLNQFVAASASEHQSAEAWDTWFTRVARRKQSGAVHVAYVTSTLQMAIVAACDYLTADSAALFEQALGELLKDLTPASSLAPVTGKAAIAKLVAARLAWAPEYALLSSVGPGALGDYPGPPSLAASIAALHDQLRWRRMTKPQRLREATQQQLLKDALTRVATAAEVDEAMAQVNQAIGSDQSAKELGTQLQQLRARHLALRAKVRADSLPSKIATGMALVASAVAAYASYQAAAEAPAGTRKTLLYINTGTLTVQSVTITAHCLGVLEDFFKWTAPRSGDVVTLANAGRVFGGISYGVAAALAVLDAIDHSNRDGALVVYDVTIAVANGFLMLASGAQAHPGIFLVFMIALCVAEYLREEARNPADADKLLSYPNLLIHHIIEQLHKDPVWKQFATADEHEIIRKLNRARNGVHYGMWAKDAWVYSTQPASIRQLLHRLNLAGLHNHLRPLLTVYVDPRGKELVHAPSDPVGGVQWNQPAQSVNLLDEYMHRSGYSTSTGAPSAL